MGWTAVYNNSKNSRLFFIEHIWHSRKNPKENWVAVDYSVIGNVGYLLLNNGAEFNLSIFLIEKSGDEWLYKEMAESAGPCVYTCPQRLLKQSTCQNELAVKWRANCRLAQKNKLELKRAITNLSTGDQLTFDGDRIANFIEFHASRRSWVWIQLENGQRGLIESRRIVAIKKSC